MNAEAQYHEEPVAAHDSPLADASLGLADNISSLQDMVAVLEKRLAAVLRPQPAELVRKDSAAVRDIATSRLVADLQKHNGRLREVRDSIGWLLERLDV